METQIEILTIQQINTKKLIDILKKELVNRLIKFKYEGHNFSDIAKLYPNIFHSEVLNLGIEQLLYKPYHHSDVSYLISQKRHFIMLVVLTVIKYLSIRLLHDNDIC